MNLSKENRCLYFTTTTTTVMMMMLILSLLVDWGESHESEPGLWYLNEEGEYLRSPFSSQEKQPRLLVEGKSMYFQIRWEQGEQVLSRSFFVKEEKVKLWKTPPSPPPTSPPSQPCYTPLLFKKSVLLNPRASYAKKKKKKKRKEEGILAKPTCFVSEIRNETKQTNKQTTTTKTADVTETTRSRQA